MGLGLVLLALCTAGQGLPIHRAALAHPWAAAGSFLLAAVVVFGKGGDRLEAAFGALCRVRRVWFNLGTFAAGFGIYGATAWYVFGGIPRIDDGVASLFQARLFARGAATIPLPEMAYFYNMFGVLGFRQGVEHWCGMYPPGWPALLTPGVWAGAPWLVNPVLGGLLIVAIGEIGRRLFGERTGRAAALLALPSPFVAVLSGLHLSHVATALFLIGALLGLLKLKETRGWAWGGCAGACWGIAFLCRPLDAVLVGGIMAFGFSMPPKRLWACRGGVAAGLAAALLSAAALLAFQQKTTGDWRVPGHELGMGKWGKFGFVQLTENRAHTPAKGIEHGARRLGELNQNLLGWAVPSMLVALLPFLLGRARTKEWMLLLSMPALLGAFGAYWYYEECYSPRYLFSSAPFLFVLSARGLAVLREAAGDAEPWKRAPAFVAVSGALFLAASIPFHFGRFGQDYYDVEELLPRVTRDYGIENALVFMDAVGLDDRKADDENDYYATGFMRNDLDMRGDVLYARNLRERNVELARIHPGRNLYLYRYLRRQEKARLYRLVPDGEGLEAVPVESRTADLLGPEE